MNLELLFFAAKITGNSHYKDIATSRADSTLKYHIRSDYSCYHVVNFDTVTGKILGRGTHQGYADYYYLEALCRLKKQGVNKLANLE